MEPTENQSTSSTIPPPSTEVTRAAFRQARKDPATCKSFTTLARYVVPLLEHPSEKTLLHIYAGMADKDTGKFQASYDYLEIQTGKERTTILRANNALRALGILSWVSGSGNQYYEMSNDYTLHREPFQAVAAKGISVGDAMMDDKYAARSAKRAKDAGKRMRRLSADRRGNATADDLLTGVAKVADRRGEDCCEAFDDLLVGVGASAGKRGNAPNASLLNSSGEPFQEDHCGELGHLAVASGEVEKVDACAATIPEARSERSAAPLGATKVTGGANRSAPCADRTGPFYEPAPTNGRKNPLFDTVINTERLKQMTREALAKRTAPDPIAPAKEIAVIDEATRAKWLAEDRAKLAAEMQRPITTDGDLTNLEKLWCAWCDKATRSEPRDAFMAARKRLHPESATMCGSLRRPLDLYPESTDSLSATA